MTLFGAEDEDNQMSRMSSEVLWRRVLRLSMCLFWLRCCMVSIPKSPSFFRMLTNSLTHADGGSFNQSRMCLVQAASMSRAIKVRGKVYYLNSESS